MNWPAGGQWEGAIGEIIILPLLFFELYRLRRSQRRDRERAQRSAEPGSSPSVPVAKPVDRSDAGPPGIA